MTRLLRRTGVSGWPRLFHFVKFQEGRASRQTELQREFPLRGLLLAGQLTEFQNKNGRLVSRPFRLI
jgi:hypothetical protein